MLITFSGIDGAGKSTQIQMLKICIATQGLKVISLWARGGYSPIFEFLKRCLRTLLKRKLPNARDSSRRNYLFSKNLIARIWLAVAIIDLILFWGIYLRYNLLRNRVVLCDRYLYDTLIDFRIKFPKNSFEKAWLWRLLVLVIPSPDISFVLWVPIDVAKIRSIEKNEPFPDDRDVLAVRLNFYLDEDLFSDRNYVRLDGRDQVDDLAKKIMSAAVVVNPSLGNYAS